MNTHLSLSLPEWVTDSVCMHDSCDTNEKKMSLAIQLSRLNVEKKTGGPFGAAIFNDATGRLLSVGVNRVVHENCCVAHAEIMAIMLGQKELLLHRFSDGLQDYVLATSAQPCAMCMGAIVWSGITKLIIGANRNDVEQLVGFDEGPVKEPWQNEFEKRNIRVVEGILRDDACDVLRLYKETEGIVY